jgi:hypothetical protein
MKKSFVAALIAMPLLSLSSMAFAAGPASNGPIQLSATQMDGVTAGTRSAWYAPTFVYQPVQINQVNAPSITILQVGNNNTAFVFTGNVFFGL